MVYKFANVHDSNEKYYYNNSDVNYMHVPLAECEGDYILTKDELRDYFGVDETRFGTLPQYPIFPRLDAANDAKRTAATNKKLVRHHRRRRRLRADRMRCPSSSSGSARCPSPSSPDRLLAPGRHPVATNQVYGAVQVSASISAGSNFGCVKMAGSASTDFGARVL